MPPIIRLLLQYAPDLIGLFAGDKAGTAAEKVAGAAKVVFGTDDPKAVQAQIEANPKLAEVFVEQARTDLLFFQIEVGDVQNARQQTVDLAKAGSSISWGPVMLSAIVTIGFFAVMALLFWVTVDLPPNIFQLLTVLFGALIPAFSQVCNYWLGSSSGSKRSGDAVRAIAEKVVPRTGREA